MASKNISLIYKEQPIAILRFMGARRREEIIRMWKHLYGKAIRHASVEYLHNNQLKTIQL